MGKTKLFLRSNKVNGRGESIIFVRYSHGDRAIDVSTGELIPPQFWDKANQRVRKSFKGHNGLNNFIDQKRNEIDSIRLELKSKKIEPTVEAVRREYRKQTNPVIIQETKSEFLLDHWSTFIRHQTDVKRLEASTIRQYEGTRKRIEDFEHFIGCRLTFGMIDGNFNDDFNCYMYNEKKFSHNSLGGKIKHLKSYMNFLFSKGITTNDKFKSFKKPSNETTIFALNQEQLDTIFYLDLAGEKRLERARDLFVLGCATGLRYSDYSAIKPGNIKDDCIIISTEKMDRQVKVPLNDYSRAIIAKYPDGLPTISNVNLNKFLKEIGIRAKFFDEYEVTTYKSGQKQKHFRPGYMMLTSHCARRTFATQSLQRGMQMAFVMRVTGHKDLRSFMRYVHVAEPKLKEEVDKAWNTLKRNDTQTDSGK